MPSKNLSILLYLYSGTTASCSQHFDYCLIELEIPLTISPFVQAIGVQESGPRLPFGLQWVTTVSPGLTVTTLTDSTTTTAHQPANPNLDRCWIAAWSDDILRTSFAELSDDFPGMSGLELSQIIIIKEQ